MRSQFLRQTSSSGDESAETYFLFFIGNIFLLLPLLYSRNVLPKSNLEEKRLLRILIKCIILTSREVLNSLAKTNLNKKKMPQVLTVEETSKNSKIVRFLSSKPFL